jgi:lipoprotein-anchoring transpeptidase ErfK/SrfK
LQSLRRATSASVDPHDFSGGGPLAAMFGMGASSIAREVVTLSANYDAGTIIINTGERGLYYVTSGGQAIRYGIGGRVGFTWAGVTSVSAKREWPDWTPPKEMLRRRSDLPRHM